MAGVVSVRSVASGMSPNRESLERRVAKWLDGQGYPLEMLVGQAFRKAGFFVVQSDYYPDPETGKPREIDVCAHIQRDSHGILAGVVYTIECKLARDKPWVLFTSADIQLAGLARVTAVNGIWDVALVILVSSVTSKVISSFMPLL